MYHLVPITCLVLLTFGVLVLRYRVEVAYTLLGGFPTLAFIVAHCSRVSPRDTAIQSPTAPRGIRQQLRFVIAGNLSHLTRGDKAQTTDSRVTSNTDRRSPLKLHLHYAAMIVSSYV